VTIRLPLADEAAIAAASGTADEEAIAAETQEVAQRAVGSATFRVPDVLVVDDDVEVLSSLKAMLIGAGLTVEGVADASIGLSKFVGYLEEADRAPGVVVTDLRLPGLLGTDMAQRVKEMSPDTRVVLVSAYVDEHTDLVNCPYLDAVLRKPFQLAELLKEVGSARV
jgi:CheY-like chemotaxis protein